MEPKYWEIRPEFKKYKPSQVAKIDNDIPTNEGGIHCAKMVKNPIIKTENRLPPRDTYFHGGNVFDGR